MQYYNPALLIVTLFSYATIQLAKKSEALHSSTWGGCREPNKDYDMICASQQLRLDKVPGAGHGVMGGKHVGFNKKQNHEWVVLFI